MSIVAGELRRQVVDTFYMKHHLRLQFERWLAKSEARQTGGSSREAQTALAAICRNGQKPPWKVIGTSWLPYSVLRLSFTSKDNLFGFKAVCEDGGVSAQK